MAESVDRVTPKKVSGFVVDTRGGGPASETAVRTRIEFVDGGEMVVGTLRPDREGYVSFAVPDLGTREPKHVWVEALGGAKRVDVLTSPLTDGVADFLLETTPSKGIGPHALSQVRSIDRLDAADARRSPASVAVQAGMVLGDGACEVPIPNTQVEQEYDLSFVKPGEPVPLGSEIPKVVPPNAGPAGVTTIHLTAEAERNQALKNLRLDVTRKPASDASGPMTGSILRFRQYWRPLGHSLGRILYSLALAPCEATNIAVIDWSRSESGRREEETGVSELLDHTLDRDRTIEEVVRTTMTEYQGGVSAGGGVGGYYGVAFGVGAGTSHSWGVRGVSAASTQDLTDTVSQVSSSFRSLRSTVVRQARESERDEIQTRTVKNFNRNHALTVQYYEVLRHYEVWTDFVEDVPVLLLPFTAFEFNKALALRFRAQLEPALLDPRLSRAFDALARTERCPGIYDEEPPAGAPAAGDGAGSDAQNPTPTSTVAEAYSLKIHTGKDGFNTHTDGVIYVSLKTADGSTHLLHTAHDLREFDSPYNADVAEVDNPCVGLALDSLIGVEVKWNQAGPLDNWLFEGIEISVRPAGSAHFQSLYVNTQVSQLFQPNNLATPAVDESYHLWTGTFSADGPPAPQAPDEGDAPDDEEAPVPPPSEVDREHDQCLANLLVGHLNDNQVHYNRAVWQGQDADERVMLLRNDPDLRASGLLDQIDLTPVGVYGSMIAFPRTGERAVPARVSRRAESKIVTIPGRGVFAETHLSHCSSAEVRDPSRDRDPEDCCVNLSAPAITGIQPGTRDGDQNLAPSSLPAPVVNIQNAPDAPDPTGLASALGVLGTPNIFRDMSLGKEVLGLVSGLASGAMSIEAAKLGAEKILSGAAGLGGGATGGGVGGSFVDGSHPTRTRNARQLHDMLKLVDSTNLPQSEKDRIAGNWLNPAAAELLSGAGLLNFANLSRGGLHELDAHLKEYLSIATAPEFDGFSHVDQTPFQKLNSDALLYMNLDGLTVRSPHEIKAQAHRAVFRSTATLEEVWQAVQTFQDLATFEELDCAKVLGDPTSLALGDRFKFTARLPRDLYLLKQFAEIAGPTALGAILGSMGGNLPGALPGAIAGGITGSLAGALIDLLWIPEARDFHIEVVHAEPPDASATGFNFGVQTAYNHPYAGRRSWRVEFLGVDGGQNRYRIETMEFNAWAWLPDYVLETILLPKLGIPNPAAETWFHWVCNVVNKVGGVFEPNPAPRTGTCPEVEFIDPPYASWGELQYHSVPMSLLANHPALVEESKRLSPLQTI